MERGPNVGSLETCVGVSRRAYVYTSLIKNEISIPTNYSSPGVCTAVSPREVIEPG